MTAGNGRSVELSLRLYRFLAKAFPYEFKNTYGEELVQATEDAIEDIWQCHGVLGLLRLLLDIGIRIPAEYAQELGRDIRYAVRMLASSPGFTAVALVSLSLGICIATSAYSELNGLILRNIFGVAKPDELVAVQAPISYPDYKRYRDRTDLFAGTFAYVAPVPFSISHGGDRERIWGHLVTPSYFPALGIHPAFGRFFEEEPEQRRQSPAAVISYRFWQDRLGSDSFVVGKSLRINGHPCTVIGVAPKGFLGASPALFAADLWLPIQIGARIAPELAGNALERRDLTMFHVVGRLRPGITQGRAEAELDSIAKQIEQDYGDTNREQKQRRVLLIPGGKVLPVRKQDLPFYTEFFMVLGGMVLLIACSNLANMMLARATDRSREIAVRLSLGASRARLIRQLLTESMLVAAGAGMIGFCLSIWVMRGASQMKIPYPTPITYDLNPDWHALLFTFFLTIFAGLGFGLVPAWQATRADLTPALKEGGAIRLRGFRRLSLRNALMLSQVAGSLTLLLITGFLVLGSQTTLDTQVGFDPNNLFLFSLDPIRDGYSPERAAAFFEKLLDHLKTIPGIKAACLTDTVPLAINGTRGVRFSANPNTQDARMIHSAQKYLVGKDYFETTGIQILQGRPFRKQDEASGSGAVIVSEALARAENEELLGGRLEIRNDRVDPPWALWPGTLDHRTYLGNGPQVFEVVGIAKDVAQGFGIEKPRPAIYFPLRQADYARPGLQGTTLIVLAISGVDIIRAVRNNVADIDANLTTFNARSMAEQIGQTLFAVRVAAWTYGFIGICGLILAAAGLAGVTSYSVAQRTREMGIRMALGVQRRDVLGLVMKEGAILVLVGTAIGLGCAWAAIHLLASVLSTVAKSTAAVNYRAVLLAGAPVLLAGLALLACFLPARKSTRIDPVLALRQE